jgi:ABC-2 type transport system permease protein
VFLSGVVYPVSAMPPLLQFIAYLMPLTYTVDGLRQSFATNQNVFVFVDVFVLVGFFIVFILPAIKLLYRRFA